MPNRAERRAAERQSHPAAYQETQAPKVSSVSEAQLAANRSNALLSSGPITAEGKAKSSRNALKHALTGATVLLPTDDATEYQRQFESAIEFFKPATEDETRLVQSVLDSLWRLNRIKSLESGILVKGQLEFASKYADQPPAQRQSLINVEGYLKYEKSIRGLHLQEARLLRRYENDKAELTRLQTERRRQERFAALRSASSEVPAAPNGFEFSKLDSDAISIGPADPAVADPTTDMALTAV